jgi:hypothetical protein
MVLGPEWDAAFARIPQATLALGPQWHRPRRLGDVCPAVEPVLRGICPLVMRAVVLARAIAHVRCGHAAEEG